MNETTQNYGLEIIDKKTEVVSPDKINRNMVKLDAELNKVQTKVEGIDVTTDVENVVNRRLNPDTSKPLSTLISEWITSAKTAILEGISTLTNHVTSQHTATKNHVSQERGNTQQTITACRDQVQNTVNVARDNINATVNTARDNIKNHVTSAMSSIGYCRASTTVRENVTNQVITSTTRNAVYLIGRYLPLKSGTMLFRIYSTKTIPSNYPGKVSVHTIRNLLGDSAYKNGGEDSRHLFSTPIGAEIKNTSGTSVVCNITNISGDNGFDLYVTVPVDKGDVILFTMNDSAYLQCNLIQACYDII